MCPWDPLPNICHKIGYLANSFMIFTFSASHQKYYFKGLLEEGSNRTSPTIKGRSSIPTHPFNFCDTWEENETRTHVTQIYLAPAHTGGWLGCCGVSWDTLDCVTWHDGVTYPGHGWPRAYDNFQIDNISALITLYVYLDIYLIFQYIEVGVIYNHHCNSMKI